MPDNNPFLYAPNLLAMAGQNPMPQAGQTLGQGITQGIQNAINPYRALMQKFGVQPSQINPNASLLPSAVAGPMPITPQAQPQPGQPGQPQRPGMPQPGQPGPMMPPGFNPNAPGQLY